MTNCGRQLSKERVFNLATNVYQLLLRIYLGHHIKLNAHLDLKTVVHKERPQIINELQ